MQQEYKVSIFSKITYFIIGGVLALCVIMLNLNGRYGTGSIVFSGFLIIGIAVFITNRVKRKVIITNIEFIKHSIFEDIKIPFTDIKGYRMVDKGFKLYYGKPWERDVYIYDFDYSSDLTTWLRENIIDLDQQEREIEYDKIINERSAIITEPSFVNDTPIATTQADNYKALSDELDERLEKFFWIMLVYDMIAVIGMLYIIVKRDLMASSFLVIYPIIGLFIIAKSKGLIRLCYKTTSPRHSLFIGMLVCASLLVLMRIDNATTYYFDHFTLLATVLSIGFIGVAWFIDTADRGETFVTRRLWLLVIGSAYGFGAIIQMEYLWGHFTK